MDSVSTPHEPTKVCTKCKREKPRSAYHVRGYTGLRHRCRECENEDKRDYYSRNREKVKAKAKAAYDAVRDGSKLEHRKELRRAGYLRAKGRDPEYVKKQYARHRESKLAAKKAYYKKYRDEITAKRRAEYLANPAPAKARAKAWREGNPEKRKEQKAKFRANKEHLSAYYKAYYDKTRDKWLARCARWQKANKDKVNAASHRRRARLAKAEGSYTAAEWQAVKAAQDHTCLRCRRREPEIKLTVDHVIPLSQGGTNFIGNIQGLCESCNPSKSDQAIDYREPPLFQRIACEE